MLCLIRYQNKRPYENRMKFGPYVYSIIMQRNVCACNVVLTLLLADFFATRYRIGGLHRLILAKGLQMRLFLDLWRISIAGHREIKT
jgi:hypothetical protein